MSLEVFLLIDPLSLHLMANSLPANNQRKTQVVLIGILLTSLKK